MMHAMQFIQTYTVSTPNFKCYEKVLWGYQYTY